MPIKLSGVRGPAIQRSPFEEAMAAPTSADSGDDGPDMLCEVCNRMFEKLLDLDCTGDHGADSFAHQAGSGSLKPAIIAGCQFCRLCYSVMDERELSSHRGTLVDRVLVDHRVSGAESLLSIQLYCWMVKPEDKELLCEIYVETVGEGRSPLLCRELSSMPDLAVARAWLNDCRNGHDRETGCAVSEAGTHHDMPTRLLHVGDAGDTDVRLVELDSGQGTLSYAVLSHCWGSPAARPSLTLTSNMEQHLRCIRYDGLCRNFQDAIDVTRALGLRYLWIDSLCIVQDDEADWQRECVRMAQIYAHAELTIAASDAGDPHAGFLHARQSFCDYEVSLRSGETWGGAPTLKLQIGGVLIQTVLRQEYHKSPSAHEHHCLDKRAWVTQERVLSRRTLSFTSKQMVFTCASCTCWERCRYAITAHGVTVPLLHWLENGRPRLISNVHLPENESAEVMRIWYGIVDAYSSCHITYGDDRLPALSGFAAHVQAITRDTYLAGLWKSDLSRGLMWTAQAANEDTHGLNRYAQQTPSPSWSWAGCDTGVSHSTCATLDDILDSETRIVDAVVSPLDLNPYGCVTDAKLTLEGHVRMIRWQSVYERWRTGEWSHALHYDDDDAPSQLLGWSQLDAKGDRDLTGRKGVVLLLASWEGREFGELHCFALVLERVEDGGEETYRRVGWFADWCLADVRQGDLEEEEHPFTAAELLVWFRETDRRVVQLV